MMLLSTITIPVSPWLWLAISGTIVTVVLLFWSYNLPPEHINQYQHPHQK